VSREHPIERPGAVPPSTDPAPHTPNESADPQRVGRAVSLHVVLTVCGTLLALPFVWMVLTSFKSAGEVNEETWLPAVFLWGNYAEVFEEVQFARFYWNSIFVTCWVTFVQVVSSAMAAYAFSRLRWPYRDRVFQLYLATMMLPGLVMMIPNYQIMIELGLVDSYTGLIITASFTPFGTFLMRQFMMGIPRSIDEAAMMDGASHWQVFWDIIMPMSRPGLITLTIFTFMGTYQSFFWPLVMLRSEELYTLPIGLLYFEGSRGGTTHLLMAAVTMSVVPMVVVFVMMQKHLVKGIQLGGVKG
jgi:ABC-type glycerol-3-phosphate transport system permease component